jgi:hypothetical protein
MTGFGAMDMQMVTDASLPILLVLDAASCERACTDGFLGCNGLR